MKANALRAENFDSAATKFGANIRPHFDCEIKTLQCSGGIELHCRGGAVCNGRSYHRPIPRR
jgi:hypothetical protein